MSSAVSHTLAYNASTASALAHERFGDDLERVRRKHGRVEAADVLAAVALVFTEHEVAFLDTSTNEHGIREEWDASRSTFEETMEACVGAALEAAMRTGVAASRWEEQLAPVVAAAFWRAVWD